MRKSGRGPSGPFRGVNLEPSRKKGPLERPKARKTGKAAISGQKGGFGAHLSWKLQFWGPPKMNKFKRRSNQKSDKKWPGGPRGPFGGRICGKTPRQARVGHRARKCGDGHARTYRCLRSSPPRLRLPSLFPAVYTPRMTLMRHTAGHCKRAWCRRTNAHECTAACMLSARSRPASRKCERRQARVVIHEKCRGKDRQWFSGVRARCM